MAARTGSVGPLELPVPLNTKEHGPDGAIEEIDKRDQGTPDEWVPRHPAMVRLTGRHPFNVEPPLPKLMEHGFITPAALHYVRNHGAVPRIKWEEHRLSVDGVVDRPTTFTMDDLLAMPARELPITLVCAGNRRKEENLVAQTIGFNWGAAGVSTSVWKGVPLRDVLIRCGIKKPSDGANHVCFVGVEKMPKGRYGTSINYWTAMDPACDVMLAYEQNGEKLRPDHGFPLRLIIPGYIGGRMIKWLNEISVTAEESDNFFHFNDNRVLPEHVTAEIANREGWWYKPDYIINELNINSAIAYPGHLEVVPLTPRATYAIKGYCYTGGGRKVIRVEVSIDGGKTWTLSKLTHPEKPTEYGRYWCWCFFEHEVALSELWQLEGAEILCRGWDAAMNRQPEAITWNVMGMMNNSYFRIKVHRVTDTNGMPALKFQHPTLAGPGNFGGWFEEKSLGKASDAPTAAANAPTAAVPVPVQTVIGAAPAAATGITMAQVEMNDGKNGTDCWFIVKDKVYNGTPFLKDHPGGASSILIVGGQDCTEEFEALHSSKAWQQLASYYIGDLSVGGGTISPTDVSSRLPPEKVTLKPKEYVTLPLEKRIELSHDTRLFRFSLPSSEHTLGLPVGQHLFIRATIGGSRVMRAYTPLEAGKGYVDFVVKVYFAGVHPRFPEGGKLTQHLDKMSIGDTIDVKGPLGEYIFNVGLDTGPLNTFTHTVHGTKTGFSSIGFIAGGSGITPVLQTARALLASTTGPPVKISILYANRSEDDILCRDTLTQIAELPNVHVWYTLDQPPAEGWKYSSGFINEDMCRANLPTPEKTAYIFICGPPPMIEYACKPSLAKVGHDPANIHCF